MKQLYDYYQTSMVTLSSSASRIKMEKVTFAT